MENKKCLYCHTQITEGRKDKKYCNAHCRSALQYAKNSASTPFYIQIKNQLTKNRNILKSYNKSGLSKTKLSELMRQGFNPAVFTHYWKNKKGQVYLFVFEFGYLTKLENGVKKLTLITWQPYMKMNIHS